MATPTTTFELIRNQWIAVIQALSPAAHSSYKFHAFESHAPFIEWANEQPQAALRVFEIMDDTDRLDPSETVSNSDVELTVSTARLLIAYPYSGGLYGSENRRDMQDMMRADANQIRKAVGINGGGNYVSGQLSCRADIEDINTEDGAVGIVTMILEPTFYFNILGV